MGGYLQIEFRLAIFVVRNQEPCFLNLLKVEKRITVETVLLKSRNIISHCWMKVNIMHSLPTYASILPRIKYLPYRWWCVCVFVYIHTYIYCHFHWLSSSFFFNIVLSFTNVVSLILSSILYIHSFNFLRACVCMCVCLCVCKSCKSWMGI